MGAGPWALGVLRGRRAAPPCNRHCRVPAADFYDSCRLLYCIPDHPTPLGPPTHTLSRTGWRRPPACREVGRVDTAHIECTLGIKTVLDHVGSDDWADDVPVADDNSNLFAQTSGRATDGGGNGGEGEQEQEEESMGGGFSCAGGNVAVVVQQQQQVSLGYAGIRIRQVHPTSRRPQGTLIHARRFPLPCCSPWRSSAVTWSSPSSPSSRPA